MEERHFRDVVCDKFPDHDRMEVARPVFEELHSQGCDLNSISSIKSALYKRKLEIHLQEMWPIWHHARRASSSDIPSEHVLTAEQRQELHTRAYPLLIGWRNSFLWLLYCCLRDMGLDKHADVAFPPDKRDHYIRCKLR